MKNRLIIGIDISKATLDLCIKHNGETESKIIANKKSAIKSFIKTLNRPAIIAMENTGKYNWPLYDVLATHNDLIVYVLNPLHLKRSLGLIRGKNDKIDAERICNYISKNQQDYKPWKPVSKSVQQLKLLLNQRKQRVKAISQLKTQRREYKLTVKLGFNKMLLKHNQLQIQLLNKQLTEIEAEINTLIANNDELAKQDKLIKSVPGVGSVISWHMLAATEGFSKLKTARKMACYAGVAPFSNQSGMFKGKNRVSIYADKSLKRLLHLGAMSAIRLENDLALYYRRKVAEGKNKMLVINAVRNKIIHRIFAVVKNQKMYQQNLVLS